HGAGACQNGSRDDALPAAERRGGPTAKGRDPSPLARIEPGIAGGMETRTASVQCRRAAIPRRGSEQRAIASPWRSSRQAAPPSAPAPSRSPFRAAAVAAEGALMRIVGGRFRGRTLAAPTSRAIRPTADRLRESLFNILIHAYGDP